MNNSQSLSRDIIYDVNFSNDFSNNDSNSITDMLINEKFISEENINELNSNEETNTNPILLLEWYEDHWYVTIRGIFATVIIILISIYIFIQYF